jgi:hypothetical protein
MEKYLVELWGNRSEKLTKDYLPPITENRLFVFKRDDDQNENAEDINLKSYCQRCKDGTEHSHSVIIEESRLR